MAYAIQGLKVKPTYEQLINVAVSDGLEQIKFPNRDASFLRNGYILSQLDGEGARIMEKQQEMATKQAFKESLLKDIAINTGSNLHELRSESQQEMRDDRIREFSTPLRSRPETYDIAGGDDITPYDTPSPSPFDTPFHDTPLHSDYSSRINRRIDFEEQEEINSRIRQQKKRDQTIHEVSQQLDEAEPIKKRVDVDTKVLTRNYLDRVYLNSVDKVQAKDDVKNEFKRIGFQTPEKASGSGDKANYADDTSRSRGRPRTKQRPDVGTDDTSRAVGRPSKYTKTDDNFWKNKRLQTLVNEFNIETGENIEINKVGKKKSKAYASNGNVMTRNQMIKILTEHNKTMQSQATRGM